MPLDTIIDIQNANIYQADHLVLTEVNFTIAKGEFVYLIGKVGSGKSSLIKSLNVELPLEQGDALVCGHSLNGIKNKQIPQLRRKMGIVFQDFKLLSDRSIEANLEFVLRATGWKNKQEIKDRIAEVLNKVNLEFKGYKMPHQLSGGEQQRVVIARALLNDPELILADEPTGNLDPETSEDIMKILLDISKNGRAVLFATHNYQLLKKYPSRVLRCEKGKVIELDQNKEIDFSGLE